MPSRSNRLLSIGVLAALLPGVVGLVRTANRVIVPAGDIISDDLYAFAGSVTIEGTGQDKYWVYDATGENQLSDWAGIRTGQYVEMLPGTYAAHYRNASVTVQVKANELTTVGG